jgi:hypothetical protein
MFLKNNCLKLPVFWSDYMAPFYRFVSDPVLDLDSNPDSNLDPKCLFQIRLGSGSGQKFRLLMVPVLNPDPQHCFDIDIVNLLLSSTGLDRKGNSAIGTPPPPTATPTPDGFRIPDVPPLLTLSVVVHVRCALNVVGNYEIIPYYHKIGPFETL